MVESGTLLARLILDYQRLNRNVIWNIASEDIALYRERVSANIKFALTQVVFG
jgi:uncharacterized protein with HEPN domain